MECLLFLLCAAFLFSLIATLEDLFNMAQKIEAKLSEVQANVQAASAALSAGIARVQEDVAELLRRVSESLDRELDASEQALVDSINSGLASAKSAAEGLDPLTDFPAPPPAE